MNGSTIERVIARLQSAWEAINSREFVLELREVTPPDAAALRGAILRVPAFLDDSISNPQLGSIFDRSAKDPVNVMAANIAAAYGVEKTYPGTTGTTGLNVPAVMTLAGQGETIGIARDCHVSVVASLSLSGAEPVYLVPPFDSEVGVLLPPTRGEVANLLDTHPEVRALVLTMPTYHGLMGDVGGIVDECHGRGVLVMVDGAHGPHFRFLRGLGFPCPAENAGADIVTQSTHKVMSALNQGSLLHFNNLELIPRYEEFQAMGFQSTSFSYPILLSLEHAIEQMIVDGERSWVRAVGLARRLREATSCIPGIHALDEAILDGRRVVGLDPTRVTLNVRDTGRSGYEICNGLLDHGVIVEMATADVLLFLVSPSVTDSFVDSTVQALRAVLEDGRGAGRSGGAAEPSMPPALPDRVLTPRQAMAAPRERVPRRQAVGRVSGESIGCYPPGQAVFVPGERITAEAVDYLTSVVEAGGHLKRVDDDHFMTIDVLRDPYLGG